MAMTGGMLGLAGSTGIANAANNGGSRKIQATQLPDHTHIFKWKWNSGNAIGGSDDWAICLENTTEGTIADPGKLWYTGGVRIIFPHTLLSMVGGELLNLLGGEQ